MYTQGHSHNINLTEHNSQCKTRTAHWRNRMKAEDFTGHRLCWIISSQLRRAAGSRCWESHQKRCLQSETHICHLNWKTIVLPKHGSCKLRTTSYLDIFTLLQSKDFPFSLFSLGAVSVNHIIISSYVYLIKHTSINNNNIPSTKYILMLSTVYSKLLNT